MKKISLIAAGALLAVGVLAGCSPAAPGNTDSGADFNPATTDAIAGTWTLESGKGPQGAIDPSAGKPMTLEIAADGQYSGASACNAILGTLTAEDGAVDMGAIGATRMACPEPAMNAEAAYIAALEAVTEGKLDGSDTLVLAGNDTELTYKRS